MNCLLNMRNVISLSAILHLKDVGYIFIGHLSQQPGKRSTIRHIYIKTLPPLSISQTPLCCIPGGNQQSVCFSSYTICNTLISGNKNISLIELFNCPLNPAERPCCCLAVCVLCTHVSGLLGRERLCL